MMADDSILRERLRRRFERAIQEYRREAYLICVRVLVAAVNDTAHNKMLFIEIGCEEPYKDMIKKILTLCNATEVLSWDYQLLKVNLIARDQSYQSGHEGNLDLITKALSGMESCLLIIAWMRQENLTHFGTLTALTISKMYYLVSLFFSRMTSEGYSLRYANKAMSLLAEGEPGAEEIQGQIEFANRPNQGVCGVCRSQGILNCGQCKVLTYCGQRCQSWHWKERHNIECMRTRHLVLQFQRLDEAHP
jgi:hypothetical protein